MTNVPKLRHISVLLSIIILFGSISLIQGIPAAAASTVSMEEGNTDGNIYNFGMVTQKGSWVYFRNDLNGKLSRMNPDGTGVTVLSSDLPEEINVVGDWVYYNADIQNGNVYNVNIYKVKTDGTHRTRLTSNRQSRLIKVIGSWIYYYSEGATSTVYKMKTDGSSKTKVYGGNIHSITVSGDWIFFNEESKDGKANPFYKIKSDGTHKTLLNSSGASNVNIADGWIYYRPDSSDSAQNHKLYKMKTDGTGVTKVSDASGEMYNVYKGWVYYRNGGIYRMKLDGSQSTELCSDYTSEIVVAGDWVYYYKGFTQYKMHLDGSDPQEMVKRVPVNISNIDVTILQNDSYSLQNTVIVTYNDNTKKEMPIKWNSSKVDTSKLGKYKFEGSVDGYPKKVVLTLNVVSADSTQNSQYTGKVVEKDGWIYWAKRDYRDIDSSTVTYTGSIYKRNSNGGDWIKVCNAYPNTITVLNDWIYIDGSALDPSARVKTDGTGYTKLGNQKSNIVKIADGWIYYENCDDSYKLYRMKTDGTSNKKVSDKKLQDPKIVNDWIYYENYPEFNIYKMKLDGTGNTKICGDSASNVQILGDWIYYNTNVPRSATGVYKIKTDGTQKTKIYGDWQNDLHVSGNWIYCSDPNGWFYRMRTDGTGRTKLSDDKIMDITIIGDWIYFVDKTDGYKAYKMKTDGTEKQLMW
ncbi:MAG TPA: DUF5050 domain-containing protein [Ruminiclostridium sp.]|nr:DUF5050 domain-containing protein [Ruminiclostridium sp.]